MTDNAKGYRHPELLVTPQALSAALAGGASPLLLDLRPAEQYAAGHLPGAVHLDIWGISLIDTDPAPLKSFLWIIEHLLAERGVSADRPVVVYEETSGTRAARAFWFLEFFGHPDVRVLDGGVRAWTAAGFPLSLDHVAPDADDVGRQSTRMELLATWKDVHDRLGRRRCGHPRHADPTASISARSCARREAARFQARFTSSGSGASAPTAHSSRPPNCRRCSSRLA